MEMQKMQSNPVIIIALDYSSAEEAMVLVNKLDSDRCALKVGKELFTREGPNFVRRLVKLGFRVFLDLKLHDIPTTVERTCIAIAEMGVWMTNVHAQGGRKMMKAAVDAIADIPNRPLLMGVTMLTSLKEDDMEDLNLNIISMRSVSLLRIYACPAHYCSHCSTSIIIYYIFILPLHLT